MIESNLANLVNENSGGSCLRTDQQTLEERRLAATQEAGNDGDRDRGRQGAFHVNSFR